MYPHIQSLLYCFTKLGPIDGISGKLLSLSTPTLKNFLISKQNIPLFKLCPLPSVFFGTNYQVNKNYSKISFSSAL